jgi:CHRD domain
VVEHILLVSVVLAALVAPSAAAPATVVVLKANLAGKYLGTTSTGFGTATITFTGSKVCWKFTYRGLDTPGVSGIHVAPPPAPGKHKTSVFPLTATTSMTPGCVAADHWGPSSAGWAKKVAADPARFYVIIGTVKYPQGAIGGTLHRP